MQWNTVEKAIKTEADTTTGEKKKKKKEWASSVGLCKRHNPQHAHHMKVSPWGLDLRGCRHTLGDLLWKLTQGEKSLAAPGNGTSVSSALDPMFNQLRHIPVMHHSTGVSAALPCKQRSHPSPIPRRAPLEISGHRTDLTSLTVFSASLIIIKKKIKKILTPVTPFYYFRWNIQIVFTCYEQDD